MPGRVIVVGSVNVDLVVSAPWLPAPGATVTGGTFARHHGGKGGNQAAAAARLGVPTVLVGAVGDDDLGAGALDALRADGVMTEHIAVLPGAATGVALIVVDPAGENLIAVASGANALVTPDLVRVALERLDLRAGDVVLVGHEIPTDAVRAALELGRGAGATTVLNPAPAEGLDQGCLALADILTPNRGELAVLAGTRSGAARPGDAAPPEDAAAALLDGAGTGAVLVTLGEDGALLVRSGADPVPIRAPHVPAVDATGAGDAFNAALAAALAQATDLEEAARQAVLAAAWSTTRPGARGGMLTRGELDRALSGSPARTP